MGRTHERDLYETPLPNVPLPALRWGIRHVPVVNLEELSFILQLASPLLDFGVEII